MDKRIQMLTELTYNCFEDTEQEPTKYNFCEYYQFKDSDILIENQNRDTNDNTNNGLTEEDWQSLINRTNKEVEELKLQQKLKQNQSKQNDHLDKQVDNRKPLKKIATTHIVTQKEKKKPKKTQKSSNTSTITTQIKPSKLQNNINHTYAIPFPEQTEKLVFKKREPKTVSNPDNEFIELKGNDYFLYSNVLVTHVSVNPINYILTIERTKEDNFDEFVVVQKAFKIKPDKRYDFHMKLVIEYEEMNLRFYLLANYITLKN